MDLPSLTSAAGGAGPLLFALFGFLVRRHLKLQDDVAAKRDEADKQRREDRDRVERERYESLQHLLRDQRAALENEIRATRSDVRLVVGDVSDHGLKLAGAAAALDGLSGRLHDVESEVKKIVRVGCAHRETCRVDRENR